MGKVGPCLWKLPRSIIKSGVKFATMADMTGLKVLSGEAGWNPRCDTVV